MSSYAAQRKRIPSLRVIGTWATWWWGVSGGYLLLLVWRGKDFHANQGWAWALRHAFTASLAMQLLLAAIVLGWAAGAWLWFRELKRHNIAYGTALKDLFFTIRK